VPVFQSHRFHRSRRLRATCSIFPLTNRCCSPRQTTSARLVMLAPALPNTNKNWSRNPVPPPEKTGTEIFA
jgi:hypothetical protein